MLTAYGVFLISAVVIILAGTRRSRYGDEIAELTGLGRLWIGVPVLTVLSVNCCNSSS